MKRNPIITDASEEKLSQWAATAHYEANKLAAMCHLSVRQLEREFRLRFARSPQDWLNKQRLEASQELLLSGLPVKKVAIELGFKQASHFNRQFKLQYNVTPGRFADSDLARIVAQG